jgi:hypothetical protein
MVHLRMGQQTYEIPSEDLDVGVSTPDGEVLDNVARHLSIPRSKLVGMRVDKDGENLTIRPEASFG